MNSYYEKFTATGVVKCIDEEIPFEIPKEWEWCRLRNLCTIFGRIGFRGYTKSDMVEKGNGAISISPSNMKENGNMDFNSCSYISWYKYEESPEIQIQINDVLVVKTGSSYGKTCFIKSLPERATINPQIAVLKFIGVIPAWLTFALNSPHVQNQFNEYVIGTSIPTFSQEKLGSTLLPCPPMQEQQRISLLIKNLMHHISHYDESQKRLAELNLQIKDNIKKSLLQEAIQGKLVPQNAEEGTALDLLKHIKDEKIQLVKEGKLKKSALNDSVIFRSDDNKYYEQVGKESLDITDNIPFGIPNNWRWVRLKDLCSICTGATFRKEEASDVNIGVRVLRGGNVLPYHLTLKPDDLYISKERVKSAIFLKEGDIVTPAVTSLENIGKMARVEREMPFVTVGGFVFIIRPFCAETYFSSYLLYYLTSPSAIEYIKSITNKSGQAFYNIGKERLLTTLVPVPPRSEQERICKQINRIFSKMEI